MSEKPRPLSDGNGSARRSFFGQLYREISKPSLFKPVGRVKNPNGWPIIALLGYGIVIANHTKYWNFGLTAGVFPLLGANIVHCIGFGCLALCIAEMASALPFTDGNYGYVRNLVDPLFGFFVGCTEILMNMGQVGGLFVGFGEAMAAPLQLGYNYEPIFWIIPLLMLLVLHRLEHNLRSIYSSVLVVMIVSAILMLLVYIFGSIPQVSYHILEKHHAEYSPQKHSTRDIIIRYLTAAPFASTLFTALEWVPITAHTATDPAYAIPRSMLVVTGLLACSSCVVIVMAAAQPLVNLQTLAGTLWPLSYGFDNMMHIPQKFAMLFNIPLFLCSIAMMINCAKRIIISMSDSGMLPHIMHHPMVALLTLVIIALLFATEKFAALVAQPFWFSSLAAFLQLGRYSVYLLLFFAYYRFSRRCSNLSRGFINPFGLVSVVVGMIIFAVMMVGVLLRTYDLFIAITFIGYCLAIMLLYSKVVKHGLKFTANEERIFFAVHIIRRNMIVKQRANKRIRRASTSSVSYRKSVQGILANIVGSSPSPKSPTTSMQRKTIKKPSATATAAHHINLNKVVPFSSSHPTTTTQTDVDDENDSGRNDEVILRLKPVPAIFNNASSTQSTTNDVLDFNIYEENKEEAEEEEEVGQELLILQDMDEEGEDKGKGMGGGGDSSCSTIKLH